MGTVKGFFDSFKEFIWDIIGYLLPGSYLLILLSTCINTKFFVTPLIGNKANDLFPYIFIIVSYLLGYVIYGFGWFKENMLGQYSYVKKIEATVATRKAFTISKQLITKALLLKGITDDLSDATVRDLRSMAMGFIPEQDQKIYTFTFRSELSNQTGNVSFIVGVSGLLFSLLKIPLNVCIQASTYWLILKKPLIEGLPVIW